MAGTVRVRGGRLELSFRPRDASFEVTHRPSGRRFRFGRRGFACGLTFEDRYGKRRLLPVTGDGRPRLWVGEGRLAVLYRGIGRGPAPAALRLGFLLQGEDLLLEMDLEDQCHPDRLVDLYYPGPFVLPRRSEAYVLLPVGQGVLVRGGVREEADGTAGWKPRLSAYHLYDGKVGVTALIETPDDVLLAFKAGAGGVGLWTRWLASFDRFGYPRRLRLCFRRAAGYVEAAALVRRFLEGKGLAVTLREKARENPRVRRLAGAVIVSDYVARVNRRNFEYWVRPFAACQRRFRALLSASGHRRFVYHLDAWGACGYDHFHPDVIPVNRAAGGAEGFRRLAEAVKRTGSLFLLHDNYNLYFLDALSFTPADCVWKRDMEPFRNTHHNGGTNAILCPERALKYIRRNYLEGKKEGRNRSPSLMEIASPTATYIDQYYLSGGQDEECWNPQHRLSRRQYRQAMVKVMEFMRRELGMVVSNEHVYDFAVPVVDFSGSSASLALGTPYDFGVPVPFFSLVFHDCLCFPMRTDGARGEEFARSLGALMLLGGMPYVFIQFLEEGKGLEGAFRRVRESLPVARLHRRLWDLPHTGHRLLDAAGSVQESTFGELSVRVDFAGRRYRVGEGRRKEEGRLPDGDL